MSLFTTSQLEQLLQGAAEVDNTFDPIPQGTRVECFNVTGGRVLVFSIVGEVTVVLGSSGGVNDFNYSFTADAGVSEGITWELCDAADVDQDAVGTLYTMTGTPTDPLVVSTKGFIPIQANGFVLTTGTIDMVTTGSSTTGAIKTTVLYKALDVGATISAVVGP